MKLKGNITVCIETGNGKNVEIEIVEEKSRMHFVKVEMSKIDLMNALGRLACVPVNLEFPDSLDRLGKKMIVDTITFPFEFEGKYEDKKKAAYEMAKKYLKEEKEYFGYDWKPDIGFNSHGSFFYKDGKNYATCTIRRWE